MTISDPGRGRLSAVCGSCGCGRHRFRGCVAAARRGAVTRQSRHGAVSEIRDRRNDDPASRRWWPLEAAAFAVAVAPLAAAVFAAAPLAAASAAVHGGGGFRGGGAAFHGGGFRGGGVAIHGGGFRAARLSRCARLPRRRHWLQRHPSRWISRSAALPAHHHFHHRHHFHRRFYVAPAYYAYPRYSIALSAPLLSGDLDLLRAAQDLPLSAVAASPLPLLVSSV